jgi:PAS domain S-box-containing protein
MSLTIDIEREPEWLDVIARMLSGIGDVAMILVDNRLVHVSNSILGYSTDEILSLPDVLALVEPADRAEVADALVRRADDLTPRRVAFRARTRDGASLHVTATVNVIPVANGVVTTVVAFDSSTHRRAVNALAHSEDWFRLAFDHSGIGMALVRPDGRILRVNRALCDYLGYDESELLTLTNCELTHPDDLGADTANIQSLLNGERVVYSMEKRYVRKDGSTVWGDLTVSLVRATDGTPLYFVSQVQDFTRRKQVEETLQRVTSSARCILWHATVRREDDAMKWDIHVLDDAAAQNVIPLDVLPGNDYATQWYLSRLPEDNPRADEVGHAALLNGDRYYRNEFRCRDRNGIIRWLSEDVYVERISETQWRCVGVCTDISDAKRAHQALAEDTRRQSSLARIAGRVVAEPDTRALTRFVLEEVVRTLSADATTVSEVLGDDKTFRITAAYPSPSLSAPFYMDDEHSLAGWALRTARPMVIRDAASESWFDPIYLRQEGFASGIAVPMARPGNRYGALGVYSVEPRIFTSEETQYCETVANVLLSAMEQATTRRYSALQRVVAETLIRADDIADAVASVVKAICDALGADYVACWIVDPSTDAYERVASFVGETNDTELAEAMCRLPMASDDTAMDALRSSLKALWCSSYHDVTHSHRFEVAIQQGIKTAIFIPVALPDRLSGVMEVYHRELLRRDARLLALLTACGNLVGDFVRRIRTQRELADVNARLEQRVAERTELLARTNADLEQFAYVASHDLQTPLRNVTSFVQLLHRRYHGQLDARADEYINFAVDGAVHMQRLLHGLLAYANVSSTGQPFRWVDAEDAFREALRFLAPVIRSLDARVTNSGLPRVVADRNQLVQVFRQLLDNGLKFRRGRPEIHAAATVRANDALFTVTDNGIGIERQYWDRIFVIFQRLHPAGEYPGTGVGLSLCKRIVERHGGTIWVDSVVGVGTTFCFTIPTGESPP